MVDELLVDNVFILMILIMVDSWSFKWFVHVRTG